MQPAIAVVRGCYRTSAALTGEHNDALLFAQSRTLRIRHMHSLNLSNARSTSPLQALYILPRLWVIFMRFRGR
jgi:hypothetical protein